MSIKIKNMGLEVDHVNKQMISAYADITAPLYWWKEFDMYKSPTVANSCNLLYNIHNKEFTIDDFSCEHLYNECDLNGMFYSSTSEEEFTSTDVLKVIIESLNAYRDQYLVSKDKKDLWQIIQLLPSSYNHRRTVMIRYAVLAIIYKYHNPKDIELDEWVDFRKWIESLPYSDIITGEREDNKET